MHNPWIDDDMSPHMGHGTAVAALAGGATLGIAPKANLYSIKVGQCGWKIDQYGDRELVPLGVTARAIRAAAERVEKVVKDRNLQGKAVINISWCKYLP